MYSKPLLVGILKKSIKTVVSLDPGSNQSSSPEVAIEVQNEFKSDANIKEFIDHFFRHSI